MKIKKPSQVKRSFFSANFYIVFYFFMALFVASSVLLFLFVMQQKNTDTKYTAVLCIWFIAFFSIACGSAIYIAKVFMVERPLRKILDATDRIAGGDFSVQIERLNSIENFNEFDIIIENLNKMARELSHMETISSDFISNISHEIKTPLAVIQNYATILQTPDLTEQERLDYASVIVRSTKELSDLISNILKLSKLENQEICLNSENFNLSRQLCRCILNFETLLDEKQLEINTDIDDSIAVTTDREMLTLVWNNLISNAIKFTEAGGKISVTAKNVNGRAEVTVSDTGCGILPEEQKRIFDKFYQGDTSHTKQGNGLGLALVKRVVDIVGGEITLDSQQEKGTTFKVII